MIIVLLVWAVWRFKKRVEQYSELGTRRRTRFARYEAVRPDELMREAIPCELAGLECCRFTVLIRYSLSRYHLSMARSSSAAIPPSATDHGWASVSGTDLERHLNSRYHSTQHVFQRDKSQHLAQRFISTPAFITNCFDRDFDFERSLLHSARYRAIHGGQRIWCTFKYRARRDRTSCTKVNSQRRPSATPRTSTKDHAQA